MKISVLMPSRGRPEQYAEAVDSFLTKAQNPKSVEIVTMLDADDLKLHEYPWRECFVMLGRQMGSSEIWNLLAAHSAGDLLMMANDDSRMRTPSWDARLEMVFTLSKFTLAWPAAQAAQCINPVIHRKWYDTLGFFMPPGYHWWYCDTALYHTAVLAGRLTYLPDVLCEHLHPKVPPEQLDDTYLRRANNITRDADLKHFRDTEKDRMAWARKLQEAMQR